MGRGRRTGSDLSTVPPNTEGVQFNKIQALILNREAFLVLRELRMITRRDFLPAFQFKYVNSFCLLTECSNSKSNVNVQCAFCFEELLQIDDKWKMTFSTEKRFQNPGKQHESGSAIRNWDLSIA